jgi:hypothetical protein
MIPVIKLFDYFSNIILPTLILFAFHNSNGYWVFA